MSVSYGVLLRAFRREAGLTQRELAQAIGNRIDFPTLSKIENLRVPPPSPDDAVHAALAEAMVGRGDIPPTIARGSMTAREIERRLREAAAAPFIAAPKADSEPTLVDYARRAAMNDPDYWEDRLAEWNDMSARP